jgi:hypothetical protein
MSELRGSYSDLVQIAKVNGEFRRNYGLLLGAYLYLRSIDAARRRPLHWIGIVSLVGSVAAGAVARYGVPW